MKLHDFPIGPYPARVRIALLEKQLVSAVTFVKVDLRAGEHKQEAFRAKNYAGTVPLLELDDGTLIAECTAITEYLDALDGNPILTGRTARDKGLIHMWTRRAEQEVLEPISLHFHHATPGLGPHVETDQNEAWGLRQRERALRGMAFFDAELRHRSFLVGDTFSMADIALVAGLIFADLVKLPIPPGCDALSAWYRAIQERPSVRDRVAVSKPQPADPR